MVNYWAVLVSAVAAMVIGSIWWGPLFGKLWIEENGLNKLSAEEQQKMMKNMGWAYFQQFILSFIQAWVLAFVLARFDRYGIGQGLEYAALFWVGFILPVNYGPKIWGTKKFSFVFITMLASLITMLAMGAIIGAW